MSITRKRKRSQLGAIIVRAAHRGAAASPLPPASGYLLDNLGNILLFVVAGDRILQG